MFVVFLYFLNYRCRFDDFYTLRPEENIQRVENTLIEEDVHCKCG